MISDTGDSCGVFGGLCDAASCVGVVSRRIGEGDFCEMKSGEGDLCEL